jgi:hypothetical protein
MSDYEIAITSAVPLPALTILLASLEAHSGSSVDSANWSAVRGVLLGDFEGTLLLSPLAGVVILSIKLPTF